MEPIQNEFIVGQGLARLTSKFQQPNCRAILAVYLRPFQELENTYFDILQARVLKTATLYALPQTNVVFDTIGALVGVAREGQSDLDYQTLIYLEIAINRSAGRITDWSRFAQILLPFCESITYLDGDNADFTFTLVDMTLPPAVVAVQLGRAVPNGVYGLLVYTVWAPGNDCEFSWSGDTTVGEAGLGWSGDTSVGGVMAAARAM